MSEASPQPIVEAIRKAKTTRVGKTVADVEAWLARKGFGRAESKLAINLAERGGDTGSTGVFTGCRGGRAPVATGRPS